MAEGGLAVHELSFGPDFMTYILSNGTKTLILRPEVELAPELLSRGVRD